MTHEQEQQERTLENLRRLAAQRQEAPAAAEPARAEVLGRHASYYAASCERLRREAAARGAADLAVLARELENLLHAHATAIALAASERDGARAREAVAVALGVEPLLSARGLSRLDDGAMFPLRKLLGLDLFVRASPDHLTSLSSLRRLARFASLDDSRSP